MSIVYFNLDMNLCFLGAYDQNRSGNRVLLDGLVKIKGINVIEINFPTPNLARDFLYNQKNLFSFKFLGNFLKRNFFLVKKFLKSNYQKFDCIVVGYPGQESVYLAYFLRTLSRIVFKESIPIIFIPYTSLLDSIVSDYKKMKKNSILTKFYYLIEYFSFHFSEAIIAHSNLEKNRYSNMYHLNPTKVFRLFLGVDENLFFPQEFMGKKKKFIVGFNGNYIPLQGIDFIIKAANLLNQNNKNIIFEIVGGTTQEIFEKKRLVKNLKISNIRFIPRVPLVEIPQTIAKSDIQLGIFGATPKTNRVIPNKVITALAMKKPIISSDTMAIRELLSHGNNCYLCKRADPESLANAVISLYEDPVLREKISNNGYKLFKNKLNSITLSKELLKIIEKVLK